MRNPILAYLREEGGVAAVEMALILPFVATFAVISVNVCGMMTSGCDG